MKVAQMAVLMVKQKAALLVSSVVDLLVDLRAG